MVLLLVVLVIGLGLLARKLVFEKTWTRRIKTESKSNGTGGLIMFNKWFKLALVSFLGIIISGFALGLLNNTSYGAAENTHAGMMNTPANNVMLQPMAMNNNDVQMNMMMQRMNQMMNRMDMMLNNMSMMNTNNMAGMGTMQGMSSMPPSGGMGMPMGMSSGGGGGMSMM